MGLQRVRHTTEQLIRKTIKKHKGIMKIKIQVVVISQKAMATHSSTLAWEIPGQGSLTGAWSAAVHRAAKGRTWLSDFTFTFHFHALEKKMATHSGVLAWRIPGTGEPGGLPSMGLHRVGHNWSDLAAAVVISEEREEEKEGKESRKSALKASKNIGILFFLKWVVRNGSLLKYYY